jgi:tetratricopeptide (TPR) repeat protein/predicted regulator of Ras-like GTPase activity (Roadblock/LC7/MglB family)
MTQPSSPEIKSLRQKLEENPDSLVFGPLADALRKEGRLDEALETCRKGLEKHGHYTIARVVLGRIYQDQKKNKEAEAEFKKVLEADPENLQALSHLGELFLAQRRHAEAIEEFQRVLALNPDDEATQQSLKKAIEAAAQDQGHPKATAPVPQSDGKAGAKDSSATLTIAELYLKQGHFDKAIEVFQELLAEDPQNLLLRQKLAAAVEQQQKHQSASGGVASKIKKDEFTRPPDPVGDTIGEDPKGQAKSVPGKTRKEGRDESKFTNEDILQVMLRGGKDDAMVEERSKPTPPKKVEPPVAKAPAPVPPAPPKGPAESPASSQLSADQVDGLKGVLAELAGVEGIQGSFLAKEDGTPVVTLGKTGKDTAGLGQLSATIFKSTRQAAERSDQGRLQQVLVTAEAGQVLLVGTAKGILVVLADEKIKIGLLRLALDSSVKKIEKLFKS